MSLEFLAEQISFFNDIERYRGSLIIAKTHRVLLQFDCCWMGFWLRLVSPRPSDVSFSWVMV